MKHIFSFLQKKNTGESLVEALVAMSILSIFLVSTFSVLGQAISTNADVRDRVIAINIAREGVEAVRNIRDTNWLKYSGDKRSKWLCLDSAAFPSACSDGTPGDPMIISGNYIVDFNLAQKRYFLTKVSSQTGNLDLTNPDNFSSYQIYSTSSPSRYTHIPTSNMATSFYRQIRVTVLPSPDCGVAPCTTNTQLKVMSLVQWREGSVVRSVTLETNLFDYLDRESYTK